MTQPDRTSPAYVRRRDRSVDDEAWIRAFLHSGAVGMLATVADGQPFINSNLYVYDEAAHCIYTHTAKAGRTRSNIDSGGDHVCFTIMEMGRLLPAPEALEFSVEYAGVAVFGSAHTVEDDDEATHALQLLLDKYAPHLTAGVDYRPPVPEELKRTAVFRIDIHEWSGKKKEVAEDFPGAFWYPAESILASVRARDAR
jgi:nitroimidazol reductase NimA-like FMN-containing flavoprotein (pyridoxamine 5'-phosphate oxidase superfamily)